MQDDKTYSTRLNTILDMQVASKAIRIELFFRNQLIVIEKSEMPYYIGRDASACDMVISDSMISRRHCVLQLRGNQIGLLDTSTNGSFVQPGRSDTLKIHNEFYPLVGKGTISLGRQMEIDDPDLIHYKVVTL